MSKFAELLAEIKATEESTTTLAKSFNEAPKAAPAAPVAEKPAPVTPKAAPAPDDAKVVAAADEGGALTDEEREAAEAEAAAKDAPLAKSEGAEALEDVDYVDATEMLKSLEQRLDESDDLLAKSIGPLIGMVKRQGDLIKSLHEQVQVLGGQGRGRRTVMVAGLDKPGLGGDLAKSEAAAAASEAMTPAIFMAKANTMFSEKKLSGVELTTIDVCLRESQPIPTQILNKVALAG